MADSDCLDGLRVEICGETGRLAHRALAAPGAGPAADTERGCREWPGMNEAEFVEMSASGVAD